MFRPQNHGTEPQLHIVRTLQRTPLPIVGSGSQTKHSSAVSNRGIPFALDLRAVMAQNQITLGFERLDDRDEWIDILNRAVADIQPMSDMDEGAVLWKWAASPGEWVAYDEATSAKLESAFAFPGHNDVGKIQVSDRHQVELNHPDGMRQVQIDDASKWRRVQRDPSSAVPDRSAGGLPSWPPVLHGPSTLKYRIEAVDTQTFLEGSGTWMLKADYLARFTSLDEAHAHIKNPCQNKPIELFWLRDIANDGETVPFQQTADQMHIPLENGRCLKIHVDDKAEAVAWQAAMADALDQFILLGPWDARETDGFQFCCPVIDEEVRGLFTQVAHSDLKVTANRRDALARHREQVAIHSRALSEGEKAANSDAFQERQASVSDFVQSIVGMDFADYELVASVSGEEGGRLATPALLNLLDLLADVLRTDDDMEATLLFACVVCQTQFQVRERLEDIRGLAVAARERKKLDAWAGATTSDVLGRDHRSHLLAWTNNLSILYERAEDMLDNYDLDIEIETEATVQDFYTLAQSCQELCQELIGEDLEDLLNGGTGHALFSTLDADLSPIGSTEPPA